jgi:hypothetical protein
MLWRAGCGRRRRVSIARLAASGQYLSRRGGTATWCARVRRERPVGGGCSPLLEGGEATLPCLSEPCPTIRSTGAQLRRWAASRTLLLVSAACAQSECLARSGRRGRRRRCCDMHGVTHCMCFTRLALALTPDTVQCACMTPGDEHQRLPPPTCSTRQSWHRSQRGGGAENSTNRYSPADGLRLVVARGLRQRASLADARRQTKRDHCS